MSVDYRFNGRILMSIADIGDSHACSLIDRQEKGRAHGGLGPEHFPCLAATPFVTPTVPTRSGKMLFLCAAVPEVWWNRGAGVSCEADHE